MCAPWCGRLAVRYAVICHDHWLTLDQYDRERIRDSYRRTHGSGAYLVQIIAETTAMRAAMGRGLPNG